MSKILIFSLSTLFFSFHIPKKSSSSKKIKFIRIISLTTIRVDLVASPNSRKATTESRSAMIEIIRLEERGKPVKAIGTVLSAR
jgi:hypothetical protein